MVQSTGSYPKVTVTADGRGVASHVGSRLLADIGEAVGLSTVFDEAVGGRRRRSAPLMTLTEIPQCCSAKFLTLGFLPG